MLRFRFCWAGWPALFGLTFVGIMLSSCSSSIPEPHYIPSPAKKHTITAPAVKPLLPEGWADITSRSEQPQIRMWIVNREYSATMVLRELQTDSATQQLLFREEMNLIATISLHGKVPENDPAFRVTRVPSMIDGKRNLSSYAYSEKGLLRRVVVFQKQNKLMELELMQEQSTADFEALTNDLIAFAVTLVDR